MPAKKSAAPKPIGEVTHFYGNLQVAIVKFTKAIPAGMRLRFKGATTDFEEVASSLQYDHESVPKAPKGKEVGIKVSKRVREGDSVYEA